AECRERAGLEGGGAARDVRALVTDRPPPRRFALLDRDGTINHDRGYIAEPDLVELLPGAAAGLKRLQAAGFGLAVVTNQSGIGRGLLDEARLETIHARLLELL